MAIYGDSFESLIKPDLREEFEKTSTTGSSFPSRRKGNVHPDFSRLNSREIKLLVFPANRIVWKNLHQNRHLDKSSSV